MEEQRNNHVHEEEEEEEENDETESEVTWGVFEHSTDNSETASVSDPIQKEGRN